MTPIPDVFPVSVDRWSACVRGTGDEVQSWTCARDVARGVVDLCRAEHWVSGLHVSGSSGLSFSRSSILTILRNQSPT